MVEKIKTIFNKLNIQYSVIEQPIICPESVVIPLVIGNSRVYFKFINNFDIDKVKIELDVVRYLKSNGIKVQEYFYTGDDSIFIYDDYCMYGTYDAGNPIGIENITKKYIIDCIKNIANMHRVLINIPIDTDHFVLESDNERFYNFYINNMDFFRKYRFDDYIDNQVKFQKCKSDYIYIHSDLNFLNITNNGTIIDFTDMKVGYREDDLGKFFQNILNTKFCSIEELDEYVKIYENNSNSKIDKARLKFSIVYRLFFRFYMSLKENGKTNEYEYLIVALEKLKKWEDCATNDKRSCLQNN